MRRRLTLFGIPLLLLAYTAGCGGSSKQASPAETSTAVISTSVPAETTSTFSVGIRGSPIRCLHAAGLSDVQERDAGSWSGVREASHYAIVVHKLKKRVKTPRVVAGTYALTGSFRIAANGRGLTMAEGLEADLLVEIVADCLRG